MTSTTSYAIRGGTPGRERLRVLARTLAESTDALFERLQVGAGLRCLDAGCGGGDVTLALARRVGPHGSVVGVDIDAAKLDIARAEAAAAGIDNVTFQQRDLRSDPPGTAFDLVYARFLLSHLADPAGTLAALGHALRPGGLLIVEEIDLRGLFVWPDIPAFQRFYALYEAVVRRRGGNPYLGARLPTLLADGGFIEVGTHIVQPMALQGEVKLINPLTLENIADAVLHDGLATRQELQEMLRDLYTFAENPRTLAGLARVVQGWAWKADHVS